jgi:thiamine biosynthesis lipoprotein ApbE
LIEPKPDAEPEPDAEPPLSLATWKALGTHVDLLVLGGDIERARAAVEAVIDDVDRTYSRFRPDSELVSMNERSGETVDLSPLLATAIDVALRAARLTDGLCDPTVGRALNRIGYDDDFARVAEPSDPIVLRIERIPGWRSLRFDGARRTLRSPVGVELDLGSTGKALAADLAAAAALSAMGRGGALVSFGGDLAIAGDVPAGGWRVLAAEDSSAAPDGPGEVIAITDGAIATSSKTVRRWQRGGVALHHVIDPRTGLPASGPWRTVSVIAGTCVDANAASTAAMIRGESGPAWVESLGLAARFVGHDGHVLRVAGWPEPDSEAGSEPDRVLDAAAIPA